MRMGVWLLVIRVASCSSSVLRVAGWFSRPCGIPLQQEYAATCLSGVAGRSGCFCSGWLCECSCVLVDMSFFSPGRLPGAGVWDAGDFMPAWTTLVLAHAPGLV